MVAQSLKMKIVWKGKGLKEKGFDQQNNCIIEISKKYFRPAEVDTLKGDYSKARKLLNWKPKKNIRYLINDMIKYEINQLNQ